MDIKKFADGFGEKMNNLYDLDKKRNKIIEEADRKVHDAFDQYCEELKEQVKLMTREDVQEYLNESAERDDHDLYMQALVLYLFVETHNGRDKRAAKNTLKLLCMKMEMDDLSDMLASVL